jgi:serine/threonine protein kinase
MKHPIIVFKENNHYKSEQEFFEKTLKNSTAGYERILKLVLSNDDKMALVFTPVGKELKKGLLRTEHVIEMLKCVEELNACNIIHRDLSPKHFFQRIDQDSLFLIDFSSALVFEKKPTNEYKCYKGSLQFAAQEILECIVEKRLHIFFNLFVRIIQNSKYRSLSNIEVYKL